MSQPTSAEVQAALDYWGALFRPHGIGATPKLESLLLGLATCISNIEGGADCQDLLPVQLQKFYVSVHGDYNNLFSLPNESLEQIYTKLRCNYSLQPNPTAGDRFVHPTIPALKRDGFLKWSVVQLLLGPNEHALFLQNALKRYDIRDPQTGRPFPKLLPRQLFPEHPNEDMTRWHQSISDEMYREAMAAQSPGESRHKKGYGEAKPSSETTSDHKHLAATYFSNPHYRNTEGRPTILRDISRNLSRIVSGPLQTAKDFAMDVIDPNLFGSRRHSVHEHASRRHSSSSDDSDPHRKPHNAPRMNTTQRDERRSRPVRVEPEEDNSGSHQDKSRQRRAFGRQRSYSHEPPQSPRQHIENRRQRAYAPGEPQRGSKQPTRTGVFVPANLPVHAPQATRLQQNNARAGVEATDYFNHAQRSASRPTRVVSQPDWQEEQGGAKSEASGVSPTEAALPPPPRASARRPSAQRQTTPVLGVHGRQYVNAAPWKKR